MRISDLLWMALKNLKGKFNALIVVGVAISAFCLCFAGAVLLTVQQEKSLPYELNVLSGTDKLSDNEVAEISKLPDVMAASPMLQVPVTVQTGGYKAQLILTGIDASYLNEAFSQGGVFPDSSAMPYIVLNKAACKLFKDKNGSDGNTGETDEPQIDWLKAAVSLQMSENSKPVISKIVGILSGDDEEQEPAAYISIASAKNLLSGDGQNTDYMGADVRIENIGCTASVSTQIAGLGLNVSNANEDMQTKWDMELGEMTYLIIIGFFSLLCSVVLAAAWRKIYRVEHKETFSALQWIGMKKRDIGRLFFVQSLMNVLLGISIGVIVSVSLPSFLAPESAGTSIFALHIPFGIVAISAATGIVSVMFPFLYKYNAVCVQ